MNTISAFTTDASTEILRNSIANQSRLATAFRQLSSGIQLNSPADGPAQYAQASNLQTAVASYDSAAASAQQGAQALNVASSAIAQIQSAVQSLRTLSIAATNTALSAQQRAVLQTQANGYVAEIDQISGQTTYQGTQLLGLDTTAATSTTTTTSTTPTVVQSATGTTGNFNTPVISLSLAQAPTAGNLLVALVTYGNGYGGNTPSQAIVAPAGWDTRHVRQRQSIFWNSNLHTRRLSWRSIDLQLHRCYP